MASDYVIDGGAYNNYIATMEDEISEFQNSVKKLDKKLHEVVMVPGKWYDSNASKFAIAYNDVTGQSDGIDKLVKSCDILETLFKTTCVEPTLEIYCMIYDGGNSTEPVTSYQGSCGFPCIDRYAKSKKVYQANGIVNISKKSLQGDIVTKLKKGQASTSKAEVEDLLKVVDSILTKMTTNLANIKKATKTNIINNKAITINGFDSTSLKTTMENIEKRLTIFYKSFTNNLKATTGQTEKAFASMKKKLEGIA